MIYLTYIGVDVEDNSFTSSLSFIFGIPFFLSFLSDFLILPGFSKGILEVESFTNELPKV